MRFTPIHIVIKNFCILIFFCNFVFTTEKEKHDVVLILDSSKFMSKFVFSFENIALKILEMMRLTKFADRIKLALIYDSECVKLHEISEWFLPNDIDKVQEFTKIKTYCENGGSIKNLQKVLNEIFYYSENKTTCLLMHDSSNVYKMSEINYNEDNNKAKYQFIQSEIDMIKQIAAKSKKYNFRIYTVQSNQAKTQNSLCVWLAKETYGNSLEINDVFAEETIIGIFLNLIGIEYIHKTMTLCIQLSLNFKLDPKSIDYTTKFRDGLVFYTTEILPIEEIKIVFNNFVFEYMYNEDYKFLVFNTVRNIFTDDKISTFNYNTLLRRFLWLILKKGTELESQFIWNLIKNFNNPFIKNYISDILHFIGDKYKPTDKINMLELYYCRNKPEIIINHNKMIKIAKEQNSKPNFISKKLTTIRQSLTYFSIEYNSHINEEENEILEEDSDKEGFFPHKACKLSNLYLNYKESVNIYRFKNLFNTKKLVTNCRNQYVQDDMFYEPLEFDLLKIAIAKYKLTNSVIKYIKGLIMAKCLYIIHMETIEVEISYSSFNKKSLDVKMRCIVCKQYRSLTLMIDEKCVYCENEAFMKIADRDKNHSIVYECQKCLSHFAYCYLEEYKSEEFCFYCIKNNKSNFIVCLICANKFQSLNKTENSSIVCGICESNNHKILTQKCEMTIKDYVELNKISFLGLFLENFSTIADIKALLTEKKLEKTALLIKFTKDIEFLHFKEHKFKIGGGFKAVLNVKDIQIQIFEKIRTFEKGRCLLCLLYVLKEKIKSMCVKDTM